VILSHRRCFVSAALLLFTATASAAQWQIKTPAVDSPYWWALTPELKPEDLRKILLNIDLHRQRFRDSQDDGELSAEDDLSDVFYFVDGGLTPELIRMSEAYASFSSLFEARPEWEGIVRESMPRYGVTQSGMDAILATVGPKNQELKNFVQAKSRIRESVDKVFDKAEEKMSRAALRDVLCRKDLQALSLASGRPVHELHLLLDLWAQNPVELVCLDALSLLEAILSEGDWEAFRRYLLAEVATGMLVVEYRDDDDLLE